MDVAFSAHSPLHIQATLSSLQTPPHPGHRIVPSIFTGPAGGLDGPQVGYK